MRCRVSGVRKQRYSIVDCGFWPPASPSCRLYKPEAIGAYLLSELYAV